MLHSWRAALRGRPWIAVAAAYVIALQALLTGIAGASLGGNAALSDQAFVICHSAGSADGSPQDDGSGKSSPDHALCALCTLARAASAILPVDHTVVPHDVIVVATVMIAPSPSEAVGFDPSIGHSPRGPPGVAGSVG